MAFATKAATYDGDDCLVWPYGSNDRGYGTFKAGGRTFYAHRYVLELVAGPPFPKAEAAHAPLICHNPSCVNPKHLRWATHAENMADTVIDGTYSPPPRYGETG